MSYQAVSHLAFVLYICVIWKQWVPVREISSHIQNQLGIRAGNDRRPSIAVSSRHFLQWDLGWVCLEERDSPLQVAWPEDLPRAATSQCQFWHVTATRRPPIAGITPDQHQSVRRSCLSVFQPSFFSWHLERVSLVLPASMRHAHSFEMINIDQKVCHSWKKESTCVLSYMICWWNVSYN